MRACIRTRRPGPPNHPAATARTPGIVLASAPHHDLLQAVTISERIKAFGGTFSLVVNP